MSENLVVRHAAFRPAFENAIEPEAFGPLKFFVFEIGVVHHFADFAKRLVFDSESREQGFEGAGLAMVREFAVRIIEGEGVQDRIRLGGEGEGRFEIDKVPDKPRGSNAIDLGPRTS
jgi:hypothetical protein